VSQITADTSVAEIVKLCPGARRIFDEHGLKGCGGEHGPTEPLAFFAAVHQASLDDLLREINAELEEPIGPALRLHGNLAGPNLLRRSLPVTVS
jgi:iron-sulfur cluster repair protein YtfE (RIC family)